MSIKVKEIKRTAKKITCVLTNCNSEQAANYFRGRFGKRPEVMKSKGKVFTLEAKAN